MNTDDTKKIISQEHQEALTRFLQCCHKKKYPTKTAIIRPGDAGECLYYIIEGSLSVNMEDNDNHEIVLAYLNKGEFIGEIGVFKGAEIREVSVKSRTQCTLAKISYTRLHQLLRTELLEYASDLLFILGNHLATRLISTSRKISDLAFLDVEGRIARTLLSLCKQPDAMTHPEGMQLHITRQEIGRIVGCSREMAGRVLKELDHKELISAHGKTIVVFGTR